ncbi:glycoside hydrolase family 97 protein [Pedobacter sp. MC2016-15]|uniref:glycoside hydrolase family 97 protein n=1 Tax=Pedobacter sp. MC2016-15 TaxID=2994473 RepID=UPI0022487087|nr:glycoside hydrolase family 97 protein [Pedobacter sp. MC2016-15]MCX2477764.1 glycoside hydrolase family 97 protein [Pedobacter sp. MC2016-15]
MKFKVAICLFQSIIPALCFGQSFKLNSPSGNIQIEIKNTSSLNYRVQMSNQVIIKDSPLGFKFENEKDMGSDLKLIAQEIKEINEVWRPVIKSKHESIKDHYKFLKLSFIEKSGLQRKLNLELRAYNDGVAFRYQLYPESMIGCRGIVRELTGFNFTGDPKAWVADYKKYNSPQEEQFLPKRLSSIDTLTKAGLPFLIEVDKSHFAAITEAKIDNYPGFYIGKESGKSDLITKLSPLPSESEQGVKARFSDILYTPWRVVMLGKTPGSLIESEIIQNLNDPCALNDVSWIKAGMSAWDHWWSGEVKQDMPTIRKYIDLASEQGWPYMIIDWQWYGPYNKPEADITKAAPELNIQELLHYAKEKNVRLWLWLYSSDVNRSNNFEKAFALYEKWGIAGIKIDFMDRDDQEMVNWYKKIIKAAAEHHLMVDFHGAYKPDGIIRTYPNMITREGVMGEEWSKFSNKLLPEHNVTLPFTRMLAGQMDYTPGGFLNITKAQFKEGSLPTKVMNTRCAELSKFVIYESPLTVNCEHPDNIINQPGADFLKIVPTVWDDIKVLSGYPGEHIILTKRSGRNFFIGAMTNSLSREIKIKLNFLPEGTYELTSWADANDAEIDPSKLIKSKRKVNQKSLIKIKMAGSGGYVAHLKVLSTGRTK